MVYLTAPALEVGGCQYPAVPQKILTIFFFVALFGQGISTIALDLFWIYFVLLKYTGKKDSLSKLVGGFLPLVFFLFSFFVCGFFVLFYFCLFFVGLVLVCF